MNKRKIFTVSIGLGMLLFSGCTISSHSQKPEIFIPKDSIEEVLQASITTPSPKKEIKTEKKDEKPQNKVLIAQKISPQGKYQFKLFSNTGNACSKERKNTNDFEPTICIFEVWENNKKEFFFEESEPGQIFEYFSGIPIAWATDKNIVFEKTIIKKTAEKHFFSTFNFETQEIKSLYQIAFWKDFSSQKKNGFISFTKNGNQYFFDPLSYNKSFRAYKVIDPKKQFFIKSSGLENLVFIDSITPSKNQTINTVKWQENFPEISFQITFLKNNKENIKNYIFSPQKGFEEK